MCCSRREVAPLLSSLCLLMVSAREGLLGVLLACALGVGAALVSPAAKELGQWLKSNGGSTTALVGPCAHGLGLLASEDVSKGDVVVSVPPACCLSAETVPRTAGVPDLVELIPSEFWSARLALHLLAERSKGDASALAMYISALPNSYTLPIFWSPDAIKLLRGYPTVQQRLLKQAKFISSFATEHLSTDRSRDECFSGLRVNADAFGWAIAACSSRAFLVGGERALVPMIDMGNHQPKGLANCDVKGTLGGKLELVANRDVPMGGELTFCYGEKLSNDDFMLDYGFLPQPANAHDDCRLAWADGGLLQSACAAAGFEAKLEAWQRASLRTALPVGHEMVSIGRTGLDERTTAACRIAAASDAASLRKSDGGKRPLQPPSSEAKALKIAAATVASMSSPLEPGPLCLGARIEAHSHDHVLLDSPRVDSCHHRSAR